MKKIGAASGWPAVNGRPLLGSVSGEGAAARSLSGKALAASNLCGKALAAGNVSGKALAAGGSAQS